eukprot:41905-Alexandrium_andersonii.AAC.1
MRERAWQLANGRGQREVLRGSGIRKTPALQMSRAAGPVGAQIDHPPILPIGDNLLGDRCLAIEEVLPRADVGVLLANTAIVNGG